MAKMLDIIGICDHNSAENVIATMRAAKRTPQENKLKVLAGMEITSIEEIHIVSIFDNVEDVLALQGAVYAGLPPGENKPEVFGEQIIANEFDEVEGYDTRLLIGATKLTVSEILEKVRRLNGIGIASHVDRPSYSVISQLGFIPGDLDLDCLEISSKISLPEAGDKFPEIRKYPVVTSSDAHALDDIGTAITNFYLAEPTLEEIRKALKNEEGRRFEVKS